MRVLVTGGASGIGRATAELLGARGDAVGLLDRDGDQLAAELASLRAAGVEAAGALADVRDSVAVTQAVSAVAESLGGLDGLVTAAGIGGYTGDVTETEIDAWERVISINLTGVFNVCRAVVTVMQREGRGSIVNISSQFGLVGCLSSPAYCAAKAGVVGLTKAMAVDHADQAIRVNCVCPGPVDTPMLHAGVPLEVRRRRGGARSKADAARAARAGGRDCRNDCLPALGRCQLSDRLNR